MPRSTLESRSRPKSLPARTKSELEPAAPDLQTKELNFNCQQFVCQISIPRFTATTKYSPPQMPTEGASNARITNLVGTIRLSASGIHDQPKLPGLKRTWRSEARNFHLQSRFDSLPVRSISHEKPLSVACVPGHVCGHDQGRRSHPRWIQLILRSKRLALYHFSQQSPVFIVDLALFSPAQPALRPSPRSFHSELCGTSRCAVHPSPGDLNIPARISDPLAGKMQSAKKVPTRKRVRKPFPPQKSPDKLSRNNGQQVIARLCFGSTIVDNAGPEIRKTNSRDATGIRIRVR